MKRSTLYYLFALAGLIITWIFNAQYLIQGGSVEPAAFFGAAMLTPLTTAITLDVYWSAIVFSIWMLAQQWPQLLHTVRLQQLRLGAEQLLQRLG